MGTNFFTNEKDNTLLEKGSVSLSVSEVKHYQYYNFETGKEDRENRLITNNPKLVNFIQNMPKEIKVTEDEFISNCWIEGNRLDVYLCGVKFSQMVKA